MSSPSLSQARYDYYTNTTKFKIPEFNSIALTYVAAGNGAGEIETVAYKKDGTTVATLTIAYNVSNEIITVTQS